MDPSEVFHASLTLVDQVVDRVCRRRRVFGADAEDFASQVKLALIEDDYGVFRKYEGRASLGTYLTVVAERLLSTQRMHDRGRWHPSTEATRMGPAGVLLETLVRRDHRPLEEALPLVQSIEPALTRAAAEAMLARLPERPGRPAVTEIDEATADVLVAPESADGPLLAAEARRLSERAACVVRETLATFDAEDRTLLRMRFVSEMSVADISRMTRLPQRPLYRRLEDLLGRLRRALVRSGISVRDAGAVIAAASSADLDFGLMESAGIRHSIPDEEPVTAGDSP
ncbi:MAG TPA: sigma-70 family RNA polymerase sigma factor [Thermoanaerobaculia bacterium]|nr:sigma-70 family RNA polymerase sigma factor [Thermoanaerobaculia bacterium]